MLKCHRPLPHPRRNRSKVRIVLLIKNIMMIQADHLPSISNKFSWKIPSSSIELSDRIISNDG